VLGHDKLNPKESDYTTILTKIKAMNPDALYYGGVQQSGVKLARQANEVMPNLLKMGGDGMYGVGFPQDAGRAAENWFATIAAPDTIDEQQAQDWVAKYQSKYGASPQDYALTAYDAVLVLDDTVSRLLTDGMPITRENVRDYAQQTSLATLQGVISFDDNGDLKDKIISVFQVKDGRYLYKGSAPQT
jgi:branched-chain amino acid transport system substrate-binding protein